MELRVLKFLQIAGLSLFAANGFGIKSIYICSVFLLVGTWIFRTFLEKRFTSVLSLLFFALLLAIWPEAVQLTSLLVAFALIVRDYNSAFILSLSAIFSAFCFWGSSAILTLFICLTVLLSSLRESKYIKTLARLATVSYLAYCTFALFKLIPLSVPSAQEFAYPYRIGDALEKALEAELSEAATFALGKANTGLTDLESVVYNEHDSFAFNELEVATANYSQPKRWSERQYLGLESLRVALSRDGFHAMNFGSALTQDGFLFLGHQSFLDIVPVGSVREGRLFFGDSDAFVNRLVPYQVNFLRALHHGSCYPVVGALGLYVLVALAIFPSFQSKPVLMALSICACFIFTVAATEIRKGDIRYVGKNTGWPHTSKMYGIARHAQDLGLNYLFGSSNASILAVAAGNSAELKDTEELAIMAGGYSQVKLPSGYIRTGGKPMGEVSGIIDSYEIFDKSGKLLGVGLVRINIGGREVTIVATGSPTKLSRKIIAVR